MVEGYRPGGGIAGTVHAFNFIRRISFPTTAQLVSMFCTEVFLPAAIALPLSGLELATTFIIPATVIILPSLVGELLNAKVFLRSDAVLDFRRLMGVELLCWAPLLVLLPLASAAASIFKSSVLWTDGLLMTVAISLPVRFLTMFSMPIAAQWKRFTAATLVPALSILAYFYGLSFHHILTSSALSQTSVLFLSSVALSTVGVIGILRGVDKSGSHRIGDAPLALFRAFLEHWLEGERKPLESRLALIGSQANVETSILAFEGNQTQSRGCIVLSRFHPGPTRNLGSGGLPSRLKAAIATYNGAIALIPHSISNHERNIIAQEDIAQLIEGTEKAYPTAVDVTTASRMLRERVGDGQASAQCFGKTALITLTLAPRSMEDLPLEVAQSVEATALGKGAKTLVIDAHNSLAGPTKISQEQAAVLTEVATKDLEVCMSLPQETFKMGVASDPLREFSLEDGIGPGGLSILILQVGDQLAAYVTVDGNNMQTGFREKALNALKALGIDDGEVMTTDNHLVTGLVRSPLGYHPVGEQMRQELFVERLVATARRAINEMEPASVGYSSFSLNLRILGSETFQSITSFVGGTARRIGRSFLWLEIVVFLASLVILGFL